MDKLDIAPPPSGNVVAPRPQIARHSDGTPVDKARRAAEQFESFFVGRMLDQITSEQPTDGPFGGGHAEKVFRGLLNEQYAVNVTRSGGLGIADSVYGEILAIQEASRR